MKQLDEYIKEQLKLENERKLKPNSLEGYPIGSYLDAEPLSEEYKRRNEFIDNFYKYEECPLNVIEKAKQIDGDYMLEMLNSHSVENLVNRINKEKFEGVKYVCRVNGTNDNTLDKKEEPKDGISILVKDKDTGIKVSNNKNFKNIIDYFNYYVTQLYYDENQNNWFVMLEPRYSKRVKNIKERNYGKAYHITNKENWELIKIRGLRSSNNVKYRYYPKRIYLILPNTNNQIEINKFINNIINIKGKSDFVILEVNLRNLNGNFYEDVTMGTKEEHYIYTYEDIPAKYIKDITYKYESN